MFTSDYCNHSRTCRQWQDHRACHDYTDPAIQGEDWFDMRSRNSELWKSVFVEDVGVVESMQRGRKASAFDGGHFSPVMDESTHHFHSWIASQFLGSKALEE
ncbi:MAG: SRPBCC family protein [Nitratireductor sp.]